MAINDEPYYEYMVTAFGDTQGFEHVVLRRQVFHGEGLHAFAEEYRFERITGLLLFVCEYLEAYDWFWLFFFNVIDLSNILDDGNPEITGLAQVDVETDEAITLQYTVKDIHFDHYNFYKNDELLETNTTWQSIFSFVVVPEEGNNNYTLVVVDTLGNTSMFTTTIIYTKKVPGFTLMVTIVVLTSLSSLGHKLKNKKSGRDS